MEFQIHENVVAEDAEERFFRICSFDLSEPGQRKMEETAFDVRARLQKKMNIQAVVRFWDKPVLAGSILQLDDVVLRCEAFCQIPCDAVKGVFVYLLTIGDTDIERETGIMTELYHDIWGTAYVESALEELCKDGLSDVAQTIYSAQQVYVSQPFGPGYYGMDLHEGRKLFALLDGSSIGVMQKSSGLLTPEKSCQGLVLVYDRKAVKMQPACEKCLGTSGGCQFCDKRNIKELE